MDQTSVTDLILQATLITFMTIMLVIGGVNAIFAFVNRDFPQTARLASRLARAFFIVGGLCGVALWLSTR